MMCQTRMILSCLILAVASGLTSGQGNASYIVVAPKILRPASSYDVSVTILKATGDVTVSVGLLSAKTTSLVQTQVTMSNGATTVVSLAVPATLTDTSYTLQVNGSGGLNFVNSSVIQVKTKTLSIFVQTDKAMYKPSQKVLFRAIVVQPDLKPFTQEMNISISDNSGNKIVQWLNQRNDTGVFTNSLQLSDQPPLGTWSIDVTAQGNTVTKTFDVAHYVLPKFEVKVDLPSYYTLLLNKRNSQPDLHATITARYTYGQPVKGSANVNISIVPYSYSYDTGNGNYRLMTVQLLNGTADIRLTIKDILALVPVPSYYTRYNYTYDLWQLLDGRTIIVVADVTETVTGKSLTGNSTVPCVSSKYTLSFLDITPSSFKPGLAVFAYMQLKQHDGTPPAASDIQSKSVAVQATCNYDAYIYSSKVTSLLVAVPASGMMMFTLLADNCSSISLSANYDDDYTNSTANAYKYLSKFNSRDDEAIQITLDNAGGQIAAGQAAVFTIKSTKNVTSYTYQLLSKGIIFKSAMVTGAPATSRQLSIPVDSQLAQKLAPSARLVAWFITSGGEIVSDSLEFTVTGAFANEVSVSFSRNTVQPSDGVSINVTAYRNSFVGLLAVDQSVLLLKSGNDVTQDEVLKDLSDYDSTSDNSGGYNPRPGPIGARPEAKRRRRSIMCFGCWWPYFLGGTDSAEVFSNAGVVVLTDALIYSMHVYPPYYYRPGMGGPEMGAGASGVAGAPAPGNGDSNGANENGGTTQPVRQNFPETWLWTDVTTGSDGRATLQATVPDTITSWVLSAFAVSPEVGLGIDPETAKLTVFKPFFVSLDLPYSIKRGEQFALQVTVFNYLTTKAAVTVTLFQSEYFAVKGQNDILPQNKTVTANIEVSSNDATSVYFWIVPYRLGQIPIQVQATSGSQAVDNVRAMLLVVSEGVPQEYSTSVFFSQSTSQTSNATLNISLPSDGTLVPGSEYFEVTAIGDLMGQSLTGLGNLLQMPYGCGEQNMLTFAPDVYVLKYLDVTDQATGPIVADAKNYINSGYQRELTYQRKDGSFSAFGEGDPSGSTWLSAFVVKCFHEARDFIPVEADKMASTLSWLLGNQARNGSFNEPPEGRVIHVDMQGGSARGVPLTAYVLIALLENSDNAFANTVQAQLQTATINAVRYLESQLSSVTSDPYALSIITYALTLANSSSANTAFQSLNALAINKDGMKYWRKSPDVDSTPSTMWRPFNYQAPSVDIEMTSYALLTYSKRRDIPGGIPVAKWIVSQRNSLGGFSSTQDTVMALQALAAYATLTSGNSGAQNLLISLTAGTLNHQFVTITQQNALVLQTVQIPSTATQVFVQASGTGVGLVQLNVKYNVRGTDAKKRRKREAPNSGISLDVDQRQTDDKHITLRVCASWLSSRSSGMAIIEIELPTGFEAENADQLQSQSSLIKRVDISTSAISIYLDELTKNATCISVSLVQRKMVSNVQPASVSAYLYYDKAESETLVYQPLIENSSYCDVCPACCQCPGADLYQCADRTCVPVRAVCNRTVECPDRSDETNCLSSAGIQGELSAVFVSLTAIVLTLFSM